MIVDLEYIPQGWKKVKIPKVLFFQEGPGVRKWQFTDEGVKLLNVGNINKGKIDLNKTSIHLSEKEANGKYAHFLVDDGDLLIACSGIVVDNFHNKIAFAKKKHLPLCLNTSTMRFKALSDKIDLNYFKYYLQTVHFTAQLQKLITGSAQLNFGPSHIKKIDLLLPPQETQKRIAQILDDAVTLKDKTAQLFEEYDLLAQSVFLDMFGDPRKNKKGWRIEEFGKHISVLTDYHANGSYQILSKNVTLSNDEDYALMVRTTDLEKNNFNNNVNFISEASYQFLKKTKIFGGEIIMNKIGSAGKVYLMPYLDRPVSLGMNAFMLRFKKSLNNLYVYYLLTSRFGETQINKRIKGAVTKTIRKDAVREIPIIVPPIELQNQFAEKIDLIEQQKELAKQELKESEDLFNCLLQKAFKGELV